MFFTLYSYTRDAHLFNYDYKLDLEKCAVERDRVFLTKKIREDTDESDEDALFDKAPEAVDEKRTDVKTQPIA